MDRLDTLVTDNLVTQLLQPDRLRSTLDVVSASRAEKAAEVEGRIAALTSEVAVAEAKIKRLYAMVEEGVTDLDDILRERLATLKLDRDNAKAALARIDVAARPAGAIAPELFEQFSANMRKSVTTGEIPARKASIQSIVDRIEVDDGAIRIIGDKTVLEHAVIGSGAVDRAGVRSFVRNWRARKDSNL